MKIILYRSIKFSLPSNIALFAALSTASASEPAPKDLSSNALSTVVGPVVAITPPYSSGLAQVEDSSQPKKPKRASTRSRKDSDVAVEPSQAREAEEIVVTGTYIRGVESAIGSQTITIDRGEIERSGFATIRDISQSLPQNFGGGATGELQRNAESGANANFGSTFNLRGLGQTATLSLVNGRRIPVTGLTASVADTSNIPLAAIERIEVLPDGASAIYGADAVAGVVNIILREDYEGQETAARYGFPTRDGGGKEYQFSHTFGHHWDLGNLILSYEYYRRSALHSKDRDFTKSLNLSKFGGGDYRIPFGSPGNILSETSSEILYALPEGQNGTNLKQQDLIDPRFAQYYDFNQDTTILPKQNRHSLFGYISHNISPEVELYLEARYTNRDDTALTISPATTVSIPSTNPYYFDVYGNGRPVRVAYSFHDDLDSNISSEVNSYVAVIGSNISLLPDWMARPFISVGIDKGRTLQDSYSTTGLQAVSESSDPNFALNPFGDASSNNRAVLEAIMDVIDANVRARVFQANVVADGPLFQLYNKTLRAAIGADFRNERFKLDIFSKSGANRSFFKREVVSLFGELRWPMVSKADDVPFIETINLSVALRYDKYRDAAERPLRHRRPVQSTTNPRVGLAWVVIDGLQLEGAYGTSFRAPQLNTLTSIPAVTATRVAGRDATAGTSYGLVLSGTDPDLKSEKATTWTVTAKIRPRFINGLNLEASYFNIDFKDQVARTPSAALMLNDPIYSSKIIRRPSLQQVQQACSSAEPSRRQVGPADCSSVGLIDFIADARTSNLARTKTDGIDVRAQYSFGMGQLGTATLATNNAFILNYKQSVISGSPLLSRKNRPQNPIDFRSRSSINWLPNKYLGINIFANYTDKYWDHLHNRRISSLTTIDLSINYRLSGKAVVDLLRGADIQLSILNIFDESPPFYEHPVGMAYDAENAEPMGRFIALSLRKQW